MNRKLLFITLMMSTLTMTAQNRSGGISDKMLQQMRSGVQNDNTARALSNAVAANNIDDLVKNRNNQGPIDNFFSIETPKQNIQDQKSSGRCWMFTGFNVLRSKFAQRTDSLQVEFSHGYLFFYDQLEKANLMLQSVIDTANKPFEDDNVQFLFKNPIGDGGTFCGVADLADKYGLVPASVVPETYSGENTRILGKLLSSKLREYGLELRRMIANKKAKKADVEKRKTEMLSTIYRMLSLMLGEPVKEFQYAFKNKEGKTVTPLKTYTPKSFYEETVGGPINGSFIMVMNDPRHPYYKTYEIELDRHVYDGHNWKYLNLPVEDIAKLAIASLKAGRKMYSSYDVGKQLDRKRGFLDTENYDYGSLMGTTFGMNKADRIATFDSGSTHAMTLTAVDLDTNGKPVKWKVENSWGSSNGANGYLIMTDRWFNEYMFRLVVDKAFVPADIQKMADSKPIMLLPDDPLFSEDD